MSMDRQVVVVCVHLLNNLNKTIDTPLLPEWFFT